MLTDLLGNSKHLKVLDYLLDNQELDYSKSDIAEGAEISRTTLNKILGELLESEIALESRKVGNARMFKLNRANLMVLELLEFDKRLSRIFLDESGSGPLLEKHEKVATE